MELTLALLCLFLPTITQAKTTHWKLSAGTLQYTLKHMLHTVSGKSTDVKGIGICDPDCNFLVASPVKSFSSDNANRDSNMLVYTKAAANPIVELRSKVNPTPGTQTITVVVKFAGNSHSYSVPVTFLEEKNGFEVQAKIAMNLSDFQIERPSLFGVACDDAVPVNIDLHLQAN